MDGWHWRIEEVTHGINRGIEVEEKEGKEEELGEGGDHGVKELDEGSNGFGAPADPRVLHWSQSSSPFQPTPPTDPGLVVGVQSDSGHPWWSEPCVLCQVGVGRNSPNRCLRLFVHP